MGNSPSIPRVLGNGNYSSYDIKLGKVANISVTKDEDSSYPCWKLVYDVDGMISQLYIEKITDKKSGFDSLSMTVLDCASIKVFSVHRNNLWEDISVQVKKDKKTGLLHSSLVWLNTKSVAEYGESLNGGVKTESLVYAGGTRKGLLVMENKKKSNEKQPYMVTVGHYYVNSGSGESGVDIGFSVVVKIGVVNGRLDYSVDGPVEHPPLALLYMIEQVVRTGKWNPSACLHCKNLKWQRRWLSESEDSDTPLPPPPRYAGLQSTANMGRFNGDANGSIIQATKVNFFKWWQ